MDADGFHILIKNKKTHKVILTPQEPCPDGIVNIRGELDGWKIKFKVLLLKEGKMEK